ncbi:CopG family transcriptional regulator [sulfur-oxidizing endosymbiont of Gigantopelta aegis]|uniref:CopG family transcriptional regulator n=1 Tax=sulfur-oxidizing endosymbiont of Gigantopelta aegis TaxID=2794934 RepID=UPI0018DE4567|nr:CopG family transcriptional regulator [sulfur-oxidizing endosymbiont of Gigantopelta aegis]
MNVKQKQKKSEKSKSNKKNTSLRLDKQTLKALKIKAIEQETSIQNLIESLILNYLKN